MEITLTIYDNATRMASISQNILGYSGELRNTLTVQISPVPAILLDYEWYVHFLLPEGTSVYKGSYTWGVGGSFDVALGVGDQILALEGIVKVQVERKLYSGVTLLTVEKYEEKSFEVKQSINAIDPASSVPVISIPPTTFPASDVTIIDAGGLIVGANVETALQELATPANVLAKLLTIDGSGSLLDADKIRGAANVVKVIATYTFTWNPGSLAAGASELSADITIAAGSYGYRVSVTAPYDLAGCMVFGYVSTSVVAKVVLFNSSGAVRDFASGTWTIKLLSDT